MSYLALRHLHMGLALLSVTLFVLRGGCALARINWRQWRVLHWLPHVIDTGLLAAGIGLAAWSHQYPLQQGWLTAKLCALVVYILLGRQALRPGISLTSRLVFLIGALLSVAYIVAVALTRSASPGI